MATRTPRTPRTPKRAVQAAQATQATPRPSAADIAAPIPFPAPGAPVATDAEFLERVAGDLHQMEQGRAALAEHHEAIEAAHARYAASSPLALRLEVVGCAWATPHWDNTPGAPNIPTFSWGTIRCPFGKTTPDQDCRDCVHHTITPLGASPNEPLHNRRYPRYGAVTPLTEEEADALAHYLRAMNKPPLRRPGAELAAIEAAMAEAKVAQAAAARRELDRQQGGR